MQPRGKGLCDDQRQHERCLRVHLYWPGIHTDLAPTHRLVGPRTAVRAVKLLCGVDIHHEVRTIPHEVGVHAVVLHESAAKDQDARLPGLYGLVVDGTNVGNEVQDEAGPLVAVEVEHVANGTIGDSRAEEGDVVSVRPITHRLRVVDLLAEAMDHLRRCPCDMIPFLLVVHPVEHSTYPILEEAIIVIRREEVANPVDALFPKTETIHGKIT
mmetsp:Transcript_96514/g.268227  ORF Transcript_96514/g.268227 Transcript_96514/m.268227 type:complete len:213 (+) Transcript_96514:422-1060(+)